MMPIGVSWRSLSNGGSVRVLRWRRSTRPRTHVHRRTRKRVRRSKSVQNMSLDEVSSLRPVEMGTYSLCVLILEKIYALVEDVRYSEWILEYRLELEMTDC